MTQPTDNRSRLPSWVFREAYAATWRLYYRDMVRDNATAWRWRQSLETSAPLRDLDQAIEHLLKPSEPYALINTGHLRSSNFLRRRRSRR